MPRGPRRGKPVVVDSGDEVERHRRTQRRIERKVAKVEANTHGGYAGPSIIEILETKLLGACLQYLAQKRSRDQEAEITDPMLLVDAQREVSTARGIVRGMAEGVAVMRNPYVADRRGVIKEIEREFIKKARAQISRTV